MTSDHQNAPISDTVYPPRIYPLDPRSLTEEQIAVTFAMTSRRPEPFDQIARQVSAETAADFHERWVLGYGHASVAEHAVVHLAAENISRLACDTLEDNRLASYTEKSSRYQVMPPDYYHTPAELAPHPALQHEYQSACRRLFALYRQLIDGCTQHLQRIHPQRPREQDAAYHLRLRRIAVDGCRAALPAATLTNVGVTANARTLERAISKLLSSPLTEERQLGQAIREQSRAVTPTLIKYAEKTDFLERIQQRQSNPQLPPPDTDTPPQPPIQVRLVHWGQPGRGKTNCRPNLRQLGNRLPRRLATSPNNAPRPAPANHPRRPSQPGPPRHAPPRAGNHRLHLRVSAGLRRLPRIPPPPDADLPPPTPNPGPRIPHPGHNSQRRPARTPRRRPPKPRNALSAACTKYPPPSPNTPSPTPTAAACCPSSTCGNATTYSSSEPPQWPTNPSASRWMKQNVWPKKSTPSFSNTYSYATNRNAQPSPNPPTATR